MNTKSVSIRKRNIWILSLTLILTIVMIPIPVKAPYETRLHIRESPPGEYIEGVPVDGWVMATVDIESPYEWDHTPDGIVAWTLDVHVDPDVLEVYDAYFGTFGYFLEDFCSPSMPWHPMVIDKENGDMLNISEIVPYCMSIGIGAGGNSCPEDMWYGMDCGLVRLRFRSKSETAHTVIDISNAWYLTADGRQEPFDVVDDGHYNQQAVPEFPIGLASEILFIPVIIYVIWRRRKERT
jgi:hypothetical protein